MNPKDLENALANNAVINKFMNNGNGSAEQIHIDDFKNKISRIEQMLSKDITVTASLRKDIDDLLINKNLINNDLRMQLDKLEVTVTQLYANQAVLMDWVKANTSKEKELLRQELLRQELPTSKENDSADKKDLENAIKLSEILKNRYIDRQEARRKFHADNEQADDSADKSVIKTPKPKFSDILNIKLLKIKDWVEHMFKSQKKIYASDLKELAQIEGILWSHVHLVKNYFMNGRIKIYKVGGGANQKWQWELKEDV